MADEIINKIEDLSWEHPMHTELQDNCSKCFTDGLCEFCKGVGTITRTEWTGTDTCSDITEKCVCQG